MQTKAKKKMHGSPLLESDPLLSAAEFSERRPSIMSARRRGSSAATTPHPGSGRRHNALPLCMSRSQQEAVVSAYAASPRARGSAASSMTGRRATVHQVNPSGLAVVPNEELPENVERAMQMMTTYPLMKVSGTAFENSLHTTHHSSMRLNRSGLLASPGLAATSDGDETGDGEEGSSPAHSGTTSVNASIRLESSAVMQSVMGDSALLGHVADGRSRANSVVEDRSQAAAMAAARTRPDNMVRLAAAMKRASMWQAIVVGAIGHISMSDEFRTLRLRHTLERHLLPVLMKRKAEKGSVVDREAVQRMVAQRQRASVTRLMGAGGGSFSALPSKDTDGEAPTSSYLREHSPFFAQLGHSVLLESLAGAMARYRFVSGEIIAASGEPSQTSLYFIVSGKCELRTKPTPEGRQQRKEQQQLRQTQFKAPSPENNVGSPTHSRSSPRFRSHNDDVEVLYAGDSFGGVFNSNATFTGTYKAISQCILWVLRADDFERIFKAFADRTMIEHYVAALRTHVEEEFSARYPLANVMPRVPIYRMLNQPMSRYMADFTPIVMVRGEKLFDQGDTAGYLYCLVEGTVRRSVKGADGTYATGVAQDLTLNTFATLKVAGRCVLLGEEPHILPCRQRYRCTIQSRTAMLFRIPGERFVSALLDDPTHYVALRERLTKLFTSQMTLSPACLGFAPLLRAFPAASLQTLAQAAEPRVYGRSVAMSEPAQGLREIYLVVSGEVRDPRGYGHHPTAPLPTPPSSDEDEDGEDATAANGAQGHRAGVAPNHHSNKVGKDRDAPKGKASGHPKGHGHKGPAGKGGAGRSHEKPLSLSLAQPGGDATAAAAAATPGQVPAAEEEKDWMTSSFFSEKAFDLTLGAAPSLEGTLSFGGTAGSGKRPVPLLHAGPGQRRGLKGSQAAVSQASPHQQQTPASTLTAAHGATGTAGERVPCVTPDEQQECNPALRPLPAKRFLYTLGGGWEGLLLDKWPNGWGTTSLVEAWAIPTAKLRAEFNGCPKSNQASILLAARETQKQELGLATLSTAKLPPMSVYQQATSAASAAVAAGFTSVGKANPNGNLGSRRTSSRKARTSPRKAAVSGQGSRSSVSSTAARDGTAKIDVLSLSGSDLALEPATTGRSGQRNHGSLDSGNLYGSKAGSQDAATPTPKAAAAAASAKKALVPVARTAPATAGSKKVTIALPPAVSATVPAPPAPPAPAASAAAAPPSWKRHRGSSSNKGRRSVQGNEIGASTTGEASRDNGTALSNDDDPSHNLLGLYKGEYRDDEMLLYSNIVRGPSLPPVTGGGRAKSSTHTAKGMAAAAWPSTVSGGGKAAGDPLAVTNGWFREVPVSEPLPGTLKTTSPGSQPAFAMSTLLLSQPAPNHGEQLQAQADYFSATNAARTAAAGESPVAARAPGQRQPSQSVRRSAASTKGAPQVTLPKRHALAW